MALDSRRIAMWASGVSIALFVAFILVMPEAMEEMMVVSEMGEQWSPQTAPARTQEMAE